MILRTSEVLSSESQLIKSNELFWYPPPCYVSIGIFRCQSLQCFHLDSTASQVCQTGTLSVRSWEVDTTHTTSPHSPSTYMHTREDRYVQSWSWPQCDSLCKGNTMAPSICSAVAKDVTHKRQDSIHFTSQVATSMQHVLPVYVTMTHPPHNLNPEV